MLLLYHVVATKVAPAVAAFGDHFGRRAVERLVGGGCIGDAIDYIEFWHTTIHAVRIEIGLLDVGITTAHWWHRLYA